METQEEMFQGSVRLGDHYGTWWSYIPHFIHTPGYVYAYAFGKLLVLALYGRYKQNADGFAEEYLRVCWRPEARTGRMSSSNAWAWTWPTPISGARDSGHDRGHDPASGRTE